MAYSVDQLYALSGTLLQYLRETASVLARVPEGASVRETFQNDVRQLIDDLQDVLDEMDDATDVHLDR